ncbi:folylpolyglutamate synthase/dihydrofolate synthase family protein [Paenibacillus larvae]
MENIFNTHSAPFQKAEEAVEWIVGLVPFGIKPGLARMERFMEMLGHPERRLKFIHVAGTNGKGSTCAFLTSVLMNSGYDVGTFTSPYLEKFTNRIQYNGQDMDDQVLVQLANRLKPIAEEMACTELGSPTMFEVSTTLAILYYATVAFPDYVVWETGLGGRLDCTNIVHPVITIITNVGYDHTEILGETLAEIASEKAGIIKAGIPVVCTAEKPEAVEVIRETAKNNKSTLYLLGKSFDIASGISAENSQKFDFAGPFRKLSQVKITLNGIHQMKNAAAALMALEVLRQYYALVVEDEILYEAMAKTSWAGRMEIISQHPRILADGAHNPEGAEALVHTLKSVYKFKKLLLMMGMLATKNHTGFFRHILPIVDTLILTEPDFHKKEEAAHLAELARTWMLESGREVELIVEPDWKLALELLKQKTEQDDLAVVSGTLYLISDVRSWILYHSHSEKGW